MHEHIRLGPATWWAGPPGTPAPEHDAPAAPWRLMSDHQTHHTSVPARFRGHIPQLAIWDETSDHPTTVIRPYDHLLPPNLTVTHLHETVRRAARSLERARHDFLTRLHLVGPPGWTGPGHCAHTPEPPTTNLARILQRFGLSALLAPHLEPGTAEFRERKRTATFDRPGTAAPWWARGWRYEHDPYRAYTPPPAPPRLQDVSANGGALTITEHGGLRRRHDV